VVRVQSKRLERHVAAGSRTPEHVTTMKFLTRLLFIPQPCSTCTARLRL